MTNTDNRVKILVCCHKPDIVARQAPYVPVHVGAKTSKHTLDMIGDDTGDNISEKNCSYCELTGMYWAWKNLKDYDVIGLCHYRRYFDFHGISRMFLPCDGIGSDRFENLDLSVPDKLINDIKAGAVVLAKKWTFRYPLGVTYCACHMSQDYRTLKQLIKETRPEREYLTFIDVMEKSNRLSPCNMFLMNAENFNSYCEWLFPILEELEKRIDTSNYNQYQKRVFGFIGERLLNVWVELKKLKAYRFPIVKIENKVGIIPPPLSPIMQLAYDARNSFLNFLYNITARD